MLFFLSRKTNFFSHFQGIKLFTDANKMNKNNKNYGTGYEKRVVDKI